MFCCVECDSKRFLTLKPDIRDFRLEHTLPTQLVLLELFVYPNNKCTIYESELNL